MFIFFYIIILPFKYIGNMMTTPVWDIEIIETTHVQFKWFKLMEVK